jgi:hypothetical protein
MDLRLLPRGEGRSSETRRPVQSSSGAYEACRSSRVTRCTSLRPGSFRGEVLVEARAAEEGEVCLAGVAARVSEDLPDVPKAVRVGRARCLPVDFASPRTMSGAGRGSLPCSRPQPRPDVA